jgi:hypothetical protein
MALYQKIYYKPAVTFDKTIREYSNSAETIVIPGHITTIGEYAFYGNQSVKNVVIKRGVKEIKNFAFANCPNLETVEIPDTVTSIGENAFSDSGDSSGLVVTFNKTADEINAIANAYWKLGVNTVIQTLDRKTIYVV